MLGLHPSERWNTHSRGTHTRTRARPLTRTHTGARARTHTCPVKHAHSRAQGEDEEDEDSDDPDFSESEDEKSNAAARGSRLAAAATGVQITPYVAAYGMRAGLSIMQINVASEPMIVQVLLMGELPERRFFQCQIRSLRRAQTTHAGTRSHTPLHSSPPALTHADARTHRHGHSLTEP